MKRLIFFTVLALIALVLTACTTGSNKVTLKNIFQLDGLDITLGCDSPCTNLNEIGFSGSFTDLPLNDLPEDSPEIPEFYWGIPPLRVLETLGFETIMTATSETGTKDKFPIHFEVVTSKLELTITDGSGSPTLSKSFTSAGDLNHCLHSAKLHGRDQIDTCTYTTDFSDPLLNLELNGGEVTTFYNLSGRGLKALTLSAEVLILPLRAISFRLLIPKLATPSLVKTEGSSSKFNNCNLHTQAPCYTAKLASCT